MYEYFFHNKNNLLVIKLSQMSNEMRALCNAIFMRKIQNIPTKNIFQLILGTTRI